MHDIHVYFIFLPLAPSNSNRDFISYYAEYIEFVSLPRNLPHKTVVTQVLKHPTFRKVMIAFFKIIFD